MQMLWTWSGVFFGYREGSDLVTFAGKRVGRFTGDEVYGRSGRYLGELVHQRLISHLGKAAWTGPASLGGERSPCPAHADAPGFPMPAGSADFPRPETL